jgi:homogentisate 1,2-dioxygenase
MERSIGKKSTEELAVMVDTFKPLMVTEAAMKMADDDYYKSWLNH